MKSPGISRDLPEFCICQPANHNTILEMLAHLKMRWSGRHDNDEINDDTPCNTLPCSHGRKVFLLLLFVAVVGEVGHHNGWVQTHSRGSNEAVHGKPSASATGLWNFAHSEFTCKTSPRKQSFHQWKFHQLRPPGTVGQLYLFTVRKRLATHFCRRWHSYQALPCKSLTRRWWWFCH